MATISFSEAIDNLYKKSTRVRPKYETPIQSYSTGFKDIDRIIGGLFCNSFMTIGGRPGMGTTAVALSIAKNLINSGNQIGIISLSQSTSMLSLRLAALLCHEPIQRLLNPDHTSDSLGRIMSEIKRKESDFLISNPRVKSEDELFEIIQEMQDKKCKVVLIDDFDFLDIEDKRRAEILHEIKNRFELSIILTTKVSSKVEDRGGDKRPFLSELKYAPIYEDISDTILLLYRAEYYGIVQDEYGCSTENIGELQVVKNSLELFDTIKVKFEPEFIGFRDLDNFSLDDSD